MGLIQIRSQKEESFGKAFLEQEVGLGGLMFEMEARRKMSIPS